MEAHHGEAAILVKLLAFAYLYQYDMIRLSTSALLNTSAFYIKNVHISLIIVRVLLIRK